MPIVTSGALAGWKRDPSEHGVILTVQVARSTEDFDQHNFDVARVALNDRQLRSLARDLARAARERGIDLGSRKKSKVMGLFAKRLPSDRD